YRRRRPRSSRCPSRASRRDTRRARSWRRTSLSRGASRGGSSASCSWASAWSCWACGRYLETRASWWAFVDWEATRAEFPTLARKTYLNTCSLGALSTSTRAAVGEFLDLWEEHGASAWYRIWLGEVQALRQKFARLIGAGTEEIAI